MKAEALKERPNYELFKQNDIVNYFSFLLPRWLFEDKKYFYMSNDARVTYGMLLNRFQLSKLNGWLNENGEVFIVYTRKEMANYIHISEKRVSAAMNELRDLELIWERRCGRGFANQIYLANVKISSDDANNAKFGPLDPPCLHDENANDENVPELTTEPNFSLWEQEHSDKLRTAETEFLNEGRQENETALLYGEDCDSPENGCFFNDLTEMPESETPEPAFKNCRNSVSKTAAPSVQEPPKRPPSYKDIKYNKQSINNQSHSQSRSSPFRRAHGQTGQMRQTDTDVINKLIENAELQVLDEQEAAVIKDAIERLYFMQSIRIGGAIYPNERIRSNLWRLDGLVVEDAVNRISKNANKIRNSSAYVVTVLFNTIMEAGSDIIVDPYLNSLRPKAGKCSEKPIAGGD